MPDGQVTLCGVWWGDEPRLIPLDRETSEALDAVAAGLVLSEEVVAALVEAGLVIYLPIPD